MTAAIGGTTTSNVHYRGHGGIGSGGTYTPYGRRPPPPSDGRKYRPTEREPMPLCVAAPDRGEASTTLTMRSAAGIYDDLLVY